jgi:hypothetical protein
LALSHKGAQFFDLHLGALDPLPDLVEARRGCKAIGHRGGFIEMLEVIRQRLALDNKRAWARRALNVQPAADFRMIYRFTGASAVTAVMQDRSDRSPRYSTGGTAAEEQEHLGRMITRE